MHKGCCDGKWTVNDEDGELQFEVENSTLKTPNGEVVAWAEIDRDNFETKVKRESEWTDSDVSGSEDGFFDSDDERFEHKLKWKVNKRVEIRSDQAGFQGAISLKVKGKTKVQVDIVDGSEDGPERPGPPQLHAEIRGESSEVSDAIFKLECNGMEKKWTIEGDDVGTGDISVPGAFHMDWTGNLCSQDAELQMLGEDVPNFVSPLVAEVILEHMHPVKLSSQMQNQARSEAQRLVQSGEALRMD